MKPDFDLKDYESGFARFDSLMQFKVKDILLVSSLFDSFILEEDGQLAQLILTEYAEYNLSYAPHIKRVSTAQEALNQLRRTQFDLIIIVRRLYDYNIADFCSEAKQIHSGIPVILLAFQTQELEFPGTHARRPPIDKAFLWNGDVKILLAIVKFIEDRLNAEFDTRLVGVRAIILIEDSVKFYSIYLPLLYAELMRQTLSLMADGINPAHRLLRMRARPKILLAHTYEEGEKLLKKYKNYLLGVISDVRFEHGGEIDPHAGIRFAKIVKTEIPDLPILLQSSNIENAGLASENNISFLHKQSPTLLYDLRQYIMENFGFGDFVFRMPDGREIARAANFHSLENCLESVDERSVVYHANRNHFSNWLMARTEFDLAGRIRPRKVSEFKDAAGLRNYLLETFRDFRREKQLGAVTDFSRTNFDLHAEFVRIGDGSLGGKGRGLAFINSLLNRYNIYDSFEGAKISVPPSAIIGTAVFDQFLEENHLRESVLEAHTDAEITSAFARGNLPYEITRDLQAYLEVINYPLVIRSSSLLEDSHYQPFAGIFDSHMLPNSHPDREERLKRLEAAVKYIYASIFFKNARSYIEATGNPIEDEKMAVIIQKAVGALKGDYFYPVISGIARSYNFYPIGYIKPDEGVAYIALGLGKTIVEGGNCLYFSPRNPDILPQFSSPKDFLKNSQRKFFAIDMRDPGVCPAPGVDAGLIQLDLEQAEADGSIAMVASTYSPNDDRVHAGISRKGIRVVTFAPVLKSKIFPLDEIIRFLLHLGSSAMNCPVEIEFAVELPDNRKKEGRFYFLQIRPMTRESGYADISLEKAEPKRVFCRSEQSLSNGKFDDIHDIIFIRPDRFDRARMPEMAGDIDRFNEIFRNEGRPYLLIGPGRWGTSDRWLGIPVAWSQISSARVIVEAAYGDFLVTPSFGTHFFQNLISSHIGYLTVEQPGAQNFIDWDWLTRLPVARETELTRHVHLEKPIEVLIDGRIGKAVILKP